MLRYSFLIMAFLFCGLQSKNQDNLIYRPAQMQADLKKFKNALEFAHPDLYEYQSKAEFNTFFEGLNSQCSVQLSRVQFHNIVLQLIAQLHEGHSTVFAINKLRSYIYQQKILPFQFFIQNERIYLIRNMSDVPIDEGSEILSINGMLSNEILNKLILHFAGDGLSRSPMEYRFGSGYHSLYREFPLIFGFADSCTIAVRNFKTGTLKVLKIATVSNDDFRKVEMNKYGNNLHVASMEEVLAQKAFSIDFNENNNYAYMRIARFFSEDYYEPVNVYQDFYADAFRQINERKVNNLIIDIRGNGGGIGSNVAELMVYLTSKKFIPTKEISSRGNDKYFEGVTKEKLDLDRYFGLYKVTERKYVVRNVDSVLELKEYEPVQKNGYKGQIYVLIDGGTLSAAGMAAGLLREYTQAVFVGQETGGFAGMSNGIRQISISGDSTDITINFPLLHSQFSVSNDIQRRGMVPDYWIENSVQDVITNRDRALEFITDKIKFQK